MKWVAGCITGVLGTILVMGIWDHFSKDTYGFLFPLAFVAVVANVIAFEK